MRIAVLGAGAMGSWFGGQLARAGSEVQLLTTNAAHRDAVRANGLVMRSAGGEQIQAIAIDEPGRICAPVDLVLLFTKAFQSESAMASVADALDDHTLVLSLQNGLGNVDAIVRYVPAERILVGNSMMPVDRIAPGIVASRGEGVSWFGSANGTPVALTRRILDAFAPTGMDVRFDEHIHRRIWHKVAFNAGMNALCALARGTPGGIGALAEAEALARDVAREVVAVAAAIGVDVDVDAVHHTIAFACANHGAHKASMLQDLEAGRRTEVEALNGAVIALGEQQGVPVPLNRVLATLVRLAERSRLENKGP